jgi:hydrogenase maturation protease
VYFVVLSGMAREQNDVLIIGYGNELRGDDAVGPRIIEAIEEWHLPGVQTIACHQLTPELADPISKVGRVIFVDASVEFQDDTAHVVPLEPAPDAQWQGHAIDPRALLVLAQSLFGKSPPAMCVHVPAMNFDLGAELSPSTQRAMRSALLQIRLFIKGP